MAVAFNYSSTAGEYTLSAPITNSATSFAVSSVTGLPSVPFKIVIDPGLSSEEIVKVTGVAGTTLTVVRGWDSSLGQAHAALAKVRHMLTAEDLRLSRQHEDTAVGVHGVAGSVVGTTDAQSLTNKNLTGAGNTFPASLVTLTGAQVVSNKDLTAGTNTFPASLATLTGAQVFTNKDMTSGTNSFPTSLVTLTGTQTLTNKTLTTVVIGAAAATVAQTVTGVSGQSIANFNNNIGGVGSWSANALSVNGGAFKAYYPVDAALVKQQVNITAPAADVRPLVVKAFAGQTANLQEWRSSADVVLGSVDPAGSLTVPTATVGGRPAMTTAQGATVATDRGVTSGTTDVNGNIFINHALGSSPVMVLGQVAGLSNLFGKPHGTVSSTQFVIHVRNTAAGTAAASTAVTIHWFVSL